MLTSETFDQIINLLEDGYTYPCITEKTGISFEDASAVGNAYLKGETEKLLREVQLAGLLELAAATLRSGEGWDENATGDVLDQILQVYPEHVRKALGMALLTGKF
jgi:hypothetical protein